MAICDTCGAEFDLDMAKMDFNIRHLGVSYESEFAGCFCLDCAEAYMDVMYSNAEEEEDDEYSIIYKY